MLINKPFQKMTLLLGSALSLLLLTPAKGFAAPYESGYKALEIWNEQAMANAPQWIQIWLGVLTLIFALGLIFVWHRPIARWAVGGFIATILIVMFAVPALGLVPLAGLMALIHVICWSPALYLLLTQRPFMQKPSLFSIWSGLLTATILFSFFFDIRDSAIYLDHMLKLGLLS